MSLTDPDIRRATTTLVVGGHSRNVGKTAVSAGLIAAFRQYPWTAVKISSHRHAGPSQAVPDEFYEERDRGGRSDTSRFLAAGASRALWVRIGEDNWESVMLRLLPIMQSSPFVLIESNRVLRFIHPDLYILVVRYDIEEFKASARETLGRVDAIVAVNKGSSPPLWKEISPKTMERIPLFSTPDPRVIPKGLVDFVQARLSLTGSS